MQSVFTFYSPFLFWVLKSIYSRQLGTDIFKYKPEKIKVNLNCHGTAHGTVDQLTAWSL